MRTFEVDTDALRRAASVISHAVNTTEPVVATAPTSNLGNAELETALAEFMQALTGGWMERVAATEAVVDTLTASAGLYETANDKGVEDLTQGKKP